MTLLDKIKSLLGLDDAASSDGDRDDRDVGVTVERESAKTESENAVKGASAGTTGTEQGGNGATTDASDDDTGESSTTEATATEPDSTETGSGEPDSADSEPAQTPSESDESASTTDEGDAADADEAETDEVEADEADESRVPSEAVDVIKGIGPTYADRLSNAGVETVADLSDADADEVAAEADVPKGRLEDWIERAKARRR